MACPVLREVVNYGTHIFEAAQRNSSGSHNLPLLFSYLHVIEMADAIEVSLSNSVVQPAKTHLRSMFEAVLGIDYMVAADTKTRSLAWLVAFQREKLVANKDLSPETVEVNDFGRRSLEIE